MDPASVFALACGIIQVVDFIAKLLSTANEYFHKGSTLRNDEFESQTASVRQLLSSLNTEETLCYRKMHSSKTMLRSSHSQISVIHSLRSCSMNYSN